MDSDETTPDVNAEMYCPKPGSTFCFTFFLSLQENIAGINIASDSRR